MNRLISAFAISSLALLSSTLASGHELRPAYLDLREEGAGHYSVLWKTPMRGDAQLALTPEFSGETTVTSEMTTRVRSGAAIQEWTLDAPALRGQTVRIRGLEGTMTDTLVRITFTDGSTWTQLLMPRAPSAEIPVSAPAIASGHESRISWNTLIAALAAWGVMCGAAAIARARRRAVWTVTAYAIGFAAAYFLIRAIVEFPPAA